MLHCISKYKLNDNIPTTVLKYEANNCSHNKRKIEEAIKRHWQHWKHKTQNEDKQLGLRGTKTQKHNTAKKTFEHECVLILKKNSQS